MSSATIEKPPDTAAYDACWDRIGVQGDRSCPKLAAAIHCRNCPVFSAAGQQLFEREAPPEYVDECTRRLTAADEVAGSDGHSLLLFRVGPEWLAIDTQAVVEVVEPRPIHRVPHRTDRLLLGLANIRGELHLCISLRELLGIEPTEGDAKSNCRSGILPLPGKRRDAASTMNGPRPRSSSPRTTASHGHFR